MSELIVTRHGRVLQLTLNRPAARNALNNALLTQLATELEAAAVDGDISACVIYGNERCFAAGADLNEMAEKDLPATLNDIRPQLWARINAFPKPLIAAVNGFALGAGCELALLCDVVIAGDNARFGLPEITLGIMPGAGGTQRLIRSVGKSLASKMVLTGESITAQQAQRAGLAVVGDFAFGRDYARTLAHWHRAFEAQAAAVRAQGFPERFLRMWRFYLSYCEAGFETGDIDVHHYVFAHAGRGVA